MSAHVNELRVADTTVVYDIYANWLTKAKPPFKAPVERHALWHYYSSRLTYEAKPGGTRYHV